MSDYRIGKVGTQVEIIKSLIYDVLPDSRIILFGSRARGDALESSDFDILVVVNDLLSVQEKRGLASLIQRGLAAKSIDADILVRSEHEIEQARWHTGSVIREAVSEGLSL
jgi:DNA polymerase sigma